MNIGKRVAAARNMAGLSQEALARRADVSVSSIRHIEQGGRPDPQLSSLTKIARDGLGIMVGELLGEYRTVGKSLDLRWNVEEAESLAADARRRIAAGEDEASVHEELGRKTLELIPA
jgi:transcriptional regulator with XRE-family HTH domain